MIVAFQVAGDVQLNRDIQRFSGRVGDAREAFVAIGEFLIDETKQQFDSEGRHASGGWKPLQKATLDRKKRLGRRLQILQETGTLRATLTQRGTPGMVFEATRSSITFGSKAPYAEAHQNPKLGSHLPQRRPIELTEGARRRVVNLLQRFLVTGQTDG